jgi:thioredoxin-related protein
VQTETGKAFKRDFGSFTPTFIFLDEEGNEVWRALGTLDPEEIRQLMK